MANKLKYFAIFFITLLCLTVSLALKVADSETFHKIVANVTQAENPSCSKDYCISHYGLQVDPFNPVCNQSAACWRQFYRVPNCTDSDIPCWKTAVGYPKDCKEDDYDCWIKAFNYSQCENVTCWKEYFNYSCKYDDFGCWKSKSWVANCKWDDWDCWIKDNSFFQLFCDKKKGYDCMSLTYGDPCKRDDEECWRKVQLLPDKKCEQDLECFKKFYYLPTCKDDDLDCWRNLYWGPKCSKGDMECLKRSIFLPNCPKDQNEVHCYKAWLGYPDCKFDDGKCWNDYHSTQNQLKIVAVWNDLYDHKMGKNIKQMSFGSIMEHKRKKMAEGHRITRQFHLKRAGLMK